ncbi:ribosome maturation factor RimM [Nitrosophilus kaiyonis]|uniref:ribosome maturation factor RimM n=1 Tax=Nitrosophilus kaiyonis TaxID=2930200 RepID=UPI002493128E|nr:ribosome maturation factor RimM [Nitrosophilus kaiyonis]
MEVAKLGRAVGLKGEMRLHLLSDFPEQFKKGAKFTIDNKELIVEYYNPKRGIIKFVGINSPEEARKLTNKIIYSSIEETRESCKLNEGEYFWFDIIGCEVLEDATLLGKVVDIQRLPSADYLLIKTDESLVEKGKAKSFLIPYIDKFIKDVNIDEKKIEVKEGLDILESS